MMTEVSCLKWTKSKINWLGYSTFNCQEIIYAFVMNEVFAEQKCPFLTWWVFRYSMKIMPLTWPTPKHTHHCDVSQSGNMVENAPLFLASPTDLVIPITFLQRPAIGEVQDYGWG